MSKRLAMQNYLPDAHKLMKELDALVKTGIDSKCLELIKIRASQLNGCSYCLNLHTHDAVKAGVPIEKIYVLSAWREAKQWFTPEEQVILQLTEEITLIGEHGVSDAVYDEAITLLGEEQVAFVMLAAIMINNWNRVGISLKLHPINYNI